MELGETYIYRIVHIENLAHILENRMLTGVNHPKANMNYVPIGESDLIEKRQNDEVKIFETGELVCPCCEFIPFYFHYRSVMLYRIQTGYNIPKIAPEKIVYFIFKLDTIIDSIDYLFTDGHGYAKITRWFNSIENLKELNKEDIERKNWYNTEADQDIQRRKQAEFWVKKELTIEKALGIAVFNENAKKQVEALLIDNEADMEVKIKKNWYYDNV